jgi:ribosomal-protein-alanine N-acetyltransferase
MAVRRQELTPAPSPLHVVITPMRRRHLRSVSRIEQTTSGRPWSLGLFMGELAMPESREYLVARVGSQVVGYAGMMLVVDEGHITTISVDPAWQRRGIGRRMLLQLARRGIERGVRQLTLEVRVGNTGAQALYQAFGFAPAGVRKAYYVENSEDALVMWSHDVDLPAYRERLAAIDAELLGSTTIEGFEVR